MHRRENDTVDGRDGGEDEGDSEACIDKPSQLSSQYTSCNEHIIAAY